MAGVVAMASVIEDFDTQPCKKSRKDGGSPVVKTITNYFSPVVKPMEKPFSPPRSNNIMDYFSRKAPTSKEKSPEQSKENCQRPHTAEKHSSPEEGKQPPQKRGRKASRAARKLVTAATVSSTEEESCIIVEERLESKDSAAEEVSTTGILGSDTAALLAQLSADGCVTAGKSKADEWAQSHEGSSKCGNKSEPKPALNTTELSPVAPSRDEAKQVKTAARHTRKRQQQEAKHSEMEEKEAESSLCDVSMEVNLDEDSQLNNSTVTISFEDFVRSQSQDEAEEDVKEERSKEDGSKNTAEAEEMHSDQLDIPKAEENPDSGEPSVQVSPRTITIQAEVHTVSPKPEAAKAVGKLASIFNRRKGVNSPAEVTSSSPEPGHQLPSPSLTVKRKSNVVLQEEDLELAVLESESIPKCSEAERKQFMAAFKQPSLDVSKTKAVKSQGKQKQPGENVLEAAEDHDVIPVSVEEASQEQTATTKKPARRGRKKAEEETEATSISAPAEEEETIVEIQDKTEEPPVTSAPSVPAARRSRRQAAIRPAPETKLTTPVRRTRKQNELKHAADAASPLDSPAEMSTPKTRKSKRGVFVAEMLCPPDAEESPIRIKFTRVHRNASKTEGGNGINTTKTSNESKKRKQAKKLVEKAKVIQQSKKSSTEEKSSLRRSSRTEVSVRRSYCEDEDSIICVEEDQTDAPQKSTTQKPLRSLNDVLGKASLSGKDAKLVLDSKVASLGQEKAPRRASAVISIFDESSHEGSENSQDDEQFRARREFLKSGLPESFRKQIAKTAATKEAYSLSCSTFQPVAHTTQPPDDCPLWSLSWPESSLLSHLKEFSNRTSKPLPSVGGSLCVKTTPACRSFCERGSGWRPEISESVRQLLVEELSTSNPQFPAQKFITRFLKRRTEHQQQFTASEPEGLTRTTSTPLPAEPAGGKRKRRDDNRENTGKVAKKQRSSQSEEKISMAEPEPMRRGGRTRRAQRSKLEEENAKPSLKAAPVPAEDDSVLILDNVLLEAGNKDVVKEDVLWTDKYQPQHSSDIIDNGASVRRLHSWLKEWKLRADREERKKQKDKKLEEGSNDSDWDCGEEDSQDLEDMCNTMLITGPTGVGKTAAVYACAQELGFKVFEVNASSQRSGRLILSQLKEATQSHQVDSQGVNAHKPSYFNSYGTSSSAGAAKPGTSPRKVNSPRRVVSSPRKHPQSPRGSKRGNLAPTSLANFFKMGQPANKEPPNTTKNEKTAASKKKANEGVGKQTAKLSAAATLKEKNSEEQSKKTATSLILFEEVDVIFDDDSGFLAAIKTFMTTTKRPVILTTSDPAFSSMFDGSFEEIHFKTPSLWNVSSYLQLLCLAEDMRTDPMDISSLLKLNSCDIRQSLLQLQFWTRSAGGRRGAQPSVQTSKNANLKPETEEAADDSVLPPCDAGCTESKLGLLNIQPEADIWELLRSPGEEAVYWELLTDSRQRGVDLLYSNMEKLLPLPLTQLTTSTFKPEQSVLVSQDIKEQPSLTCLQSDTMPPDRLLHTTDLADSSEDASPVKVSTRMRKNKRRHHLADQDGLQSDSEDEFVSLSKLPGAPQAKEDIKETTVSERVKKKPLTPEEQEKSLPVSQCLESIADFFDNMSYMDSSLMLHPHGGDLHRRMSPVSAVLKDGMTDELRVEADRGSWMMGGHVLEIQAAVEALSFRKCRASVAESWEKAQQIGRELGKEAAAELSLPMAAHRDGYSFTQDGFCQPQLIQRRREVMESLMLKGVFGNKPAAALDYLPIIRSICRSEQLKERGKVKRRFLHYLDAIHLGLDKSTLQDLAEDFP
ncbi:ATPase family AAA domain-containing protein 5 [Amphiprion ocellaris]|uniref:AAA+ ATPase domain-containing protein n=1 Tax=Amphiprion ocellaris TaxID=80972 RepID=A0A3Q1AYX2_AMPOC|nr:ATPase family AAA domain-containing protein 5 [Amphiprion ocellaris]